MQIEGVAWGKEGKIPARDPTLNRCVDTVREYPCPGPAEFTLPVPPRPWPDLGSLTANPEYLF